MSKLPYYTDDPLVDREAHRLNLHADEEETAGRGYRATFGSCSCGEWTTPTWDDDAVFDAYDSHMQQVQATVHERHGNAFHKDV